MLQVVVAFDVCKSVLGFQEIFGVWGNTKCSAESSVGSIETAFEAPDDSFSSN